MKEGITIKEPNFYYKHWRWHVVVGSKIQGGRANNEPEAW